MSQVFPSIDLFCSPPPLILTHQLRHWRARDIRRTLLTDSIQNNHNAMLVTPEPVMLYTTTQAWHIYGQLSEPLTCHRSVVMVMASPRTWAVNRNRQTIMPETSLVSVQSHQDSPCMTTKRSSIILETVTTTLLRPIGEILTRFTDSHFYIH